MGYQPFSPASLVASPRPTDAALSRRLPLMRGFAAARLDGATRVRFSYGLPTLFAGFVSGVAASNGRSPLKAAPFDARLRRGAPRRRDTSSILVWATNPFRRLR